MSTKEQTIEPRWYVKFFEYWKNRNRIGPATVELEDCDFFIVAPRRTLRVLKPSLKGEWYYENTSDRPESINDNFFARWSKRPHSSNHCRCSFRQSNRLSTNDEEIISTELNRIRNSLYETPEKSARDIEELEQRVSANLQKLQIPDAKLDNNNEKKTKDKVVLDPSKNLSLNSSSNEEQKAKNKIVKDLERYINVLLEEILDDTIKYVANSNDSNLILKNDRKVTKERSKLDHQQSSSKAKGEEIFNEISFSFHADDKKIQEDEKLNVERTKNDQGYINRAFIGSAHDPDSLDFYLRTRTIGTEVILEQLDCIDSGINSVETIEFQPDQEPSLEQSLLRIIDEKLGRTPLRNSWEDLRTNEDEKYNESSREIIENDEENKLTKLKDVIILNDNEINDEKNIMDIRQLEESIDDPKFENVRLELENDDLELSERKETTIETKFCARFRANIERRSKRKNDDERLEVINTRKETKPLEMEDYRKRWPNLEESTRLSNCEQIPHDYVIFRRNRKPTLVFLHGFGSSAEIFEHQLEYFSAMGYPCIAPDLLGHGMSSSPDRSKDYTFSKLLKDLETVLHYYAFEPGQKCILIAHNYGCSFATALACKYDSNIHQLVLISGGGPTPLAPPTREGAGRCFLRAILSPLLMCGLHRDILYSARGRQHPYCGPEPIEQWPSHMKYVLDGMAWPEGDYVFHRRIFTPTLLIHGLRDNKVSLVQECQMERTMLKAFLEAIPSAGHTPMTDCPDQLNHMIHCFIDLWKNKNW
ncbi:uncharacterized protein LOC124430628 [Vespa crabro]|uniref:uncharacterized protein LOC124430628 n=1 Tax=Vespa crabro TaxID=7445 RepID=UPI001F02DB1D|nr:uncharacterized protein LOC124430628 [Vespa crabro]XP_046833443.1 uncharacterized protein LOC124430628 [Vespa crabro]